MPRRDTVTAAALVLASALLHVFSFPPAGLPALAFISLAPLVYAIDKTQGLAPACALGALFGTAITAGLSSPVHHAITVHYGQHVIVSISFILLAMALPVSILYGLAALACRYFHSGSAPLRALTCAAVFTMAEYAKEALPLLLPWGGIGMPLVPLNRYVQMADITGPYGLTFITALGNCLLAQVGAAFPRVRASAELPRAFKGIITSQKSSLILFLCIIIVPLLYGTARLGMLDMPAAKSIKVRVVQGNFGQKTRWMESSFPRRLATHLELSEREGDDGVTRLVVWPETVLNAAGRNSDELFAFIMAGLGQETTLIAGGVRRAPGGAGFYNTAFIIDSSGMLRWYDKRILLPWAEFSPFGSIFGSFYSAPAEFLRGTSPLAVDTALGRAGISICFEVLYAWHARRAVADGAEFLVNISNDGWFGRTSEPMIHLNAAVLRAIETRRYLIRSSNSGISAVVDPGGRILAATGLFTKEAADAAICPRSEVTVYTRFGDWILYAAALLLFAQTMIKVFREK